MQKEKLGFRDQSYSAWHRIESTQRYLKNNAKLLAMIDADATLYIEYDDKKKYPIALIETAKDVGQPYKTATVIKNLAKRANLFAFVLLYKLSDSCIIDSEIKDIEEFKVKQLYPKYENKWTILTPSEWANKLLQLHCDCGQCKEFNKQKNWCNLQNMHISKIKRCLLNHWYINNNGIKCYGMKPYEQSERNDP